MSDADIRRGIRALVSGEIVGLDTEMLDKIRDSINEELWRRDDDERHDGLQKAIGGKLLALILRPRDERDYILTFKAKRRRRHRLSGIKVENDGKVSLHSGCLTGSITVGPKEARGLLQDGRINPISNAAGRASTYFGIPGDSCGKCWR